MNYEEMWNDLKETLLEKRTHVRKIYGKMNLREISLLWVLREMQNLTLLLQMKCLLILGMMHHFLTVFNSKKKG